MTEDRKKEQLQIRVTPAEKAFIRKAAERAGKGMSEWIMERLAPAESDALSRILAPLSKGEPPSLVLAELNDFLSALKPESFDVAVSTPPDKALPPVTANQIAAMVELAAARIGRHPPAWTRDIAPLEEPYFASTLQSLRLHLLVSSPPPFRMRNIFVDASLGDRV